jgi:dTDP-L-rhamnose 4-epimerase
VQILITGGAGFIGSHVADELLRRGHRVRALDNLDEQVHPARQRPDYLDPAVDLHVGDVRDPQAVACAIEGVDAVIHLAAKVGVGQSMYEVSTYVGVNDLGTAVLLESLIGSRVRRLLVASSMSIYGEGLMLDADGGRVETVERSVEQLRRGQWEPRSGDGRPLHPVPTPEDKRPALTSLYALGKFAQERMCLITGRAYGIPTTALRFFNVYGPRQALSNPYTGVLAIFASRLLNEQPPLVFEDGAQRRDFVHVRDVARACRIAVESDAGAGLSINIASGVSISIGEIAERLIAALGRSGIRPHVTGQYRLGDIRHCFADTSLAAEVLGFHAEIPFEDGLRELVHWLSGCAATDKSEEALRELARRGLVA